MPYLVHLIPIAFTFTCQPRLLSSGHYLALAILSYVSYDTHMHFIVVAVVLRRSQGILEGFNQV